MVVRNLTARRIAVAAEDGADAALVIPPFGERLLAADQMARYRTQPWQAQRLVKAVAEGEAAPAATRSRAPWRVGTWRSMTCTLHLLCVLVITFGATLAAVWLVTGFEGATWAHDLALMVVWLFLALASVIPAALYYFFHRQKLPILRTNFVRDVVRLDPNVQTVEDAETAYDALIKDVYGSGATGEPPGGGASRSWWSPSSSPPCGCGRWCPGWRRSRWARTCACSSCPSATW